MRTGFEEIPLSELTTPRQGYVCMLDYFWLIGPRGGALAFVEYSLISAKVMRKYPQANTQEIFGKMMVAKGHGNAVDYQKIPVAYWPPRKGE